MFHDVEYTIASTGECVVHPDGHVVHCWEGEHDDAEPGSERWQQRYLDRNRGWCLLVFNHPGPHDFIPASELGVTTD